MVFIVLALKRYLTRETLSNARVAGPGQFRDRDEFPAVAWTRLSLWSAVFSLVNSRTTEAHHIISSQVLILYCRRHSQPSFMNMGIESLILRMLQLPQIILDIQRTTGSAAIDSNSKQARRAQIMPEAPNEPRYRLNVQE